MARQRTRAAEYHAPGHISNPSPKFAVDEIANAPCGQRGRNQRRDEIGNRKPADALFARDIQHGDNYAQKSAMERHASLPYRQDIEGVRKIIGRFVEQHVTQTTAQNHAQHAEKKQIVEYSVRDISAHSPLDAIAGEQEGDAESHQVHQAVPAHGHWAYCDRDGINLRMNQHRLAPPEEHVAVARNRPPIAMGSIWGWINMAPV